jgi:predicted Ser/Thr protein kinase
VHSLPLPESAAAPGTRWGASGRYVIEHFVGAGGMGKVYAATDTLLGRTVALKVLNVGSDITDGRGRKLIMREARFAAQVENERIARVYDVGEHGDLVFVAMEFVRGPTLRSWMTDYRPTVGETATVASQIAEGLRALHTRGVIHRDLKPENVMISESGAVKLLDFGLARRHAVDAQGINGKPAGAFADSDGDSSVGFSGTPGYMAPERFLGAPLDPRLDIYALGVIVYELVTGARPFPGGRPSFPLDEVRRGSLFTEDAWLCVPGQLRDIVGRMLAPWPADRVKSAVEVLQALDECSGRDEPLRVARDDATPYRGSRFARAGGDVLPVAPTLPAPATGRDGGTASRPLPRWAAGARFVGAAIASFAALGLGFAALLAIAGPSQVPPRSIDPGAVVVATPSAESLLEDGDYRAEATRMMPIVSSGRLLSEESARELEAALVADPTDVDDRLRLIGYGQAHAVAGHELNQAVREKLASQALWFVGHHPDHPALRLFLHIGPGEGDVFHEAQVLWRRQVDTYPLSASVAGNAAGFYRSFDSTEAVALYERARSLRPDEEEWLADLADVHLNRARIDSPSAPKEAAIALDEYRDLLGRPTLTFRRRASTLALAAKAAMIAGESTAADDFARECIASGSGDDIHDGHIVLGKLALKGGDLALAGAELVLACKVTPTPALMSFGPDMTLANMLLRRGNREAVLAYLEACVPVWKSGNQQLTEWAAVVRRGGLPDFGVKAY